MPSYFLVRMTGLVAREKSVIAKRQLHKCRLQTLFADNCKLSQVRQRTKNERRRNAVLFFWYGWQDLNLHAIALEPKSSVSANFTTSAKHHYYSTKIDYVKSLLPRGKHFLFFYLKIVAFCRLIWYSNCCLREWLSGRVSPCQGESRGSESRLPLHA